ncbi:MULTISPECIES: gamma-type small acid-soluble spore protein [unclassified Lysinibacillus]|uniref:gamma-type small acid-soluble spore protein n=1 Tax=unclassified Lysinibacillus TaxID=2636778 RepID=UPI00380FCED1
MANNNQYKTDVNHVKQQNQQAEAKKKYASGSTNSMKSMDVEFGTETDVNHVKQQNQQAEAKKKYASGRYANENNSK